MPKIIIQASAGEGHVTLSERVIAANLDSPHYTAQLIERIAWATDDAEAIESGAGAGERNGCRVAHRRRALVAPEPPRVRAGV